MLRRHGARSTAATARAARAMRASTAASSSPSRAPRVYCRPICPARAPKDEHIRYFPTAAAAEAAGFRPVPSLPARSVARHAGVARHVGVVSRALRLIGEGALDGDGVERLADRLGVTARHLRRLFLQHLGATPLDVALTRRVHFAKKLLDETTPRRSARSRSRRASAASAASTARSAAPTRARRPSCGGWRGSVSPPSPECYRLPPRLPSALRLGRRAGFPERARDARRRVGRAVALSAHHHGRRRSTAPSTCRASSPARRSAWRSASPIRARCCRSSSGCGACSISAPIPAVIARTPRRGSAAARAARAASGHSHAGRVGRLRARGAGHPRPADLGSRRDDDRRAPRRRCSARRSRTAAAGSARLFPTPAQLADAAIERAGVMPARAEAIRSLARHVADGTHHVRAVHRRTRDDRGAQRASGHRRLDRGVHRDARARRARCVSQRRSRAAPAGRRPAPRASWIADRTRGGRGARTR